MDNELYHHGIKGQKWGVRRYQDKDGSLTNAGYKRYTDKRFQSYNKDLSSKQKKMIKNISGNKKVNLKKGTYAFRISPKENDQKSSDRMYTNLTKSELDVYIKEMTESAVCTARGKAYIQTYALKNNLKVPSSKVQTKIEKKLLKDPRVVEEIKNQSYMYYKEHFDEYSTNKKLDLLRKYMGSQENSTVIRDSFRKELTSRGYLAYRDDYDRVAEYVKANASIVILDPLKNTSIIKSNHIDKDTYAKSYANFQLKKDIEHRPNIRKDKKKARRILE